MVVKMNKSQIIDRRQACLFIGSASILTSIPIYALGGADDVKSIIKSITAGQGATETDIYLDLPEIAENGNQVKISFEIDSPMSEEEHVKAVYILADGNPAPKVAKFMFTPALGACAATTRMRLAKTQNVYLLAEFSDGTFASAKSTVKVTIGGCGG